QGASGAGREILQRHQRLIFDTHQAPGVVDQRLTRRRQADLARVAFQELKPKLLLQDLDALGDGRLSQPQAFGCVAVVLVVCDRDKRPEGPEFQGPHRSLQFARTPRTTPNGLIMNSNEQITFFCVMLRLLVSDGYSRPTQCLSSTPAS